MGSLKSKPKITIVGAGLGGALMASYLGRMGFAVDVYEKRPDPSYRPGHEGRSINLALSHRGIYALEQIGAADEVLEMAIPMRGRMMHDLKGNLTFQPYSSKASDVIYSVSRASLNTILLKAANKSPGVKVFYSSQCLGVNLDADTIEIKTAGEGNQITASYEILIAADGAYSAVCRQMQRWDRFNYEQSYLEHGYKELTIPATSNSGFALEKHALHIWPRGHFMMIALPNRDGSFTATLFWPCDGENSFAALTSQESVGRFFKNTFPDAVGIMPNLAEDFLTHPVGSLVTVRCSPWHWRDKVVLLGDACHAVVPFYGQGMNAAFEDCAVLKECIERYAPKWEEVFQNYQRIRKENVDALAKLALGNFIEMRDKVASRSFLAKKKFEHFLHKLFPGWFIPLYTMVTFTRMPYAKAAKRARIQETILQAAAAAIAAVFFLIAVFWWRRII